MNRIDPQKVRSKIEEYLLVVETSLQEENYEKTGMFLDRLSTLVPYMTIGEKDFYEEVNRILDNGG